MVENIIELKGITKQFPGVLANDNINLSIRKGEVHAIVGENGAGKSTLMKILYGLEAPTAGEIFFEGKATKITNPSIAIDHGIGMVHQHFMLLPSLTVAENIVLGREFRKNKIFVDFTKAIRVTEELVEAYGLKVNPRLKVQEVSVGIQQRIEILKVLHKGADILILDEPTAVLTPQETEELFSVIRRLVKELNKTVIIITHKLQEVLALSHRVSVMRQGKLVGTIDTKDATEQILAEMMVGREVLFDALEKKEVNRQKVLEVKELKVRGQRGLMALRGVSFDVKAGEILGIAGVEGNGQSELLEALTGLREIEAGEVLINEKSTRGKNPKEIRKLGMAHVPEDRLMTGLSKKATITENMMMGIQDKEPYAIKGIHINEKPIRQLSDRLIEEFDVRTPSQDVLVESLSGGNMQKIVIAREFSFNTPLLIISQPTRGVDIGAIEFIHQQIIDKRNEGSAILLVSAELDELFRLSDRILTIYEGEITGEFKTGRITKKEIGLYMTGKQKMNQEGGA
ncbi:ABC transporter ATP-binding protein [Natronincola ferrireducens]|uniref:Nucleoside ABC transporter ATP-binding protein n=1 Tax=Natronincola ferrireducens TaxID=393762 RepID=A0A1G9HCD2_9FIRM|nr:ABC transporter ATP-binding protein [Natronincola ferrireducens]SDL10505.1 nucleoside ABC transporter ATP-binding protein [Natronincola ferrireducens]